MVCKGVSPPPISKPSPSLLRSPHFLKSPIPQPDWQIGHPKFSLLTEICNCEIKFIKLRSNNKTTLAFSFSSLL